MKPTRSFPWIVPALLMGLQMALVLPFLDQPFHMDDPIYLDYGRHILRDPLHPQDFPYCFEGACAADMASHSHPPLNGYWAAIGMKLAGAVKPAPWAMHAWYLIFPLLFAGSMLCLARRFTANPMLAALLAVASPAAVVLSHTLMADFPTLALWTAGVAFFIRGSDHHSTAWLAVSSLCLTLAAFCSYPALLAALLCRVYAALHPGSSRLSRRVPLLPFLFMAGWIAYSSLYFGRFILSGTVQYALHHSGSFWGAMGDKIVAFPLLLAGTLCMPWMMAARAAALWNGRAAALALMVSMTVAQLAAPGYALPEKLLVIVLCWLGLLILLCLILRAARILGQVWHPCSSGTGLAGPGVAEKLFPSGFHIQLLPPESLDILFLMVWFASHAAAALFLYTSSSARYFLPLIPPLALLAASSLPAGTFRPFFLWTARISVAFSVLGSFALSLADAQTASVYRRMGQDLGNAFAGWEPRVRFGGEWGFRYAMESNGFRSFPSAGPGLYGGDFLVLPEQAVPYAVPPDTASIAEPVAAIRYIPRFPLRLMSRESHAGFYSSGWGLLPFGFSRSPAETVFVRQVNRAAETLPEAQSDCSSIREIRPVPAPQGGIDLLFPGRCSLSIPLGKAPPSRIRFYLPADDSHPSWGFRLEAFLESKAKEIPLDARFLQGEEVRLELPATSEGDFLRIGCQAGPGQGRPWVVRNLVRIPSGFRVPEVVHVP